MKALVMILTTMLVQGAFADGISIDPAKGIDAGNNRISNLVAPGVPGDAVTKGYADDQLAGHAANASAHHARYDDAEAVAAILAADGADSGLDADKLDGFEAEDFILDVGSGGYLPIPVGSLFLDNSSFSRWGVILPANGTSSFTVNAVAPKDIYYPNTINTTEMIVEIMVHSPGSAGACQAVIEPLPKDRASYLRVAFKDGYYSAALASDVFPPFVGANSSISQEYRLTGVPPESPFFLEITRKGDDPADNCGDVSVAGVAIRYPVSGRSNAFW